MPPNTPEGGRVCPASSNAPPKPGDADTLKPDPDRLSRREGDLQKLTEDPGTTVENQSEMLSNGPREDDLPVGNGHGDIHPAGRDESANNSRTSDASNNEEDFYRWEPKPPKVLMKDPDTIPLELRSQIQMYAATEQVASSLRLLATTHPSTGS